MVQVRTKVTTLPLTTDTGLRRSTAGAGGRRVALLEPPLARTHLALPSKDQDPPRNFLEALILAGRDHPAVTATILAGLSLAGTAFVAEDAQAATRTSFPDPSERVRSDMLEIERLAPPETSNSASVGATHTTVAQDSHQQELRDKVSKLVETRFGSNYRQAFDHYDDNGDGGIDKRELSRLLEDAKVGNMFTRGAWVDGIMERLDKQLGNRDGQIQWSEFMKAVSAPELV